MDKQLEADNFSFVDGTMLRVNASNICVQNKLGAFKLLGVDIFKTVMLDKNLRKCDISTPCIVLYTYGGKSFSEFGMDEFITNSNNILLIHDDYNNIINLYHIKRNLKLNEENGSYYIKTYYSTRYFVDYLKSLGVTDFMVYMCILYLDLWDDSFNKILTNSLYKKVIKELK